MARWAPSCPVPISTAIWRRRPASSPPSPGPIPSSSSTADTANDAVGDYILRLAKIPGPFTVPTGDQGGALNNGGNHPGHIGIGDLDMWTFTLNQNETAVVGIGEVPVGAGVPDPGFWPWIRIYGPLGAFVPGTHQYGDLAAQASFVAPLSGTYTVVVSTADAANDAEGDYILRLAKMPGTFMDENGGALTNGGNHPGHIDIGDLDMWSFTINQNETAVVSIGEVPVGSGVPDPGFWPWIRIYNPLGAFVAGTHQYGDRAAQASFVASLSGTYTVVVSTADSANDAVGDYILRLARMPGAFTVPGDDHGGAMTNGVNHPGRIEVGDLDMWSFAACPGASAVVTINEVPVGPGTPDPGLLAVDSPLQLSGSTGGGRQPIRRYRGPDHAHSDAVRYVHGRGRYRPTRRTTPRVTTPSESRSRGCRADRRPRSPTATRRPPIARSASPPRAYSATTTPTAADR